MPKRFLNIEYSGIRTRIDVTDFEDLSEVQDAVKAKYGDAVPVGYALIQLYDQQNQQITDLDDIPKDYYKKVKEGGLFLVVQTSPPPTRESSKNQLYETGIDYLRTEQGNSRKKRKYEWKVSENSLAKLTYDPNSTIFELDSEYLAETGLPTQNLILYCRSTFHEQFKFLQEEVINKSVSGWILGPRGTGKSTTALAFASTLDRNDWVVTWIHLKRRNYPVCVRLEGDTKKSCQIYGGNIEELLEILEEVDVTRQHIVFIDGYALNGVRHIDVEQACYSWLEIDREKRRLVIVCSMSSRYKVKLEEDIADNIKEFFVYSWKEEEYLAAVQNDEFFNNVLPVLNDGSQIDSPREDLVRSKLYYAGASARWMFLFSTETIIEQTHTSVSYVGDIIPHIKGIIGHLSDNVVNRLFSSSLVDPDDRFSRKVSIISQFVAVKLAIKAGPDLIRNLASVTVLEKNPFMDGWLFEMWFFASLCHGGVKLFERNGEEFQTWPESNVKILDIKSFPSLSKNSGLWFKPIKWNQGGFDAVFLDKGKQLIKFVQVTSGDTHSFNIKHFRSFLDSLARSSESFQVKDLEIIFLIDQRKHDSFKIKEPTGQGLLEQFGWERGTEKDRVKTVGMIGWSN